MRTIKFRGYNAKNKEWLYGCYLINRGEHFICPDGEQPHDKTWEDFQIDPETLGQFTGLHDKNGKEIYEGDIFQCCITKQKSVVRWSEENARFVVMDVGRDDWYNLDSSWLKCAYTLVGNIHTNPELQKGGKG